MELDLLLSTIDENLLNKVLLNGFNSGYSVEVVPGNSGFANQDSRNSPQFSNEHSSRNFDLYEEISGNSGFVVPYEINDRFSELAFDTTVIICPVCGNEAGKHTHYGGRGCSSCRAFFRRSVQNRTFEAFKCPGNQACRIDSKSWKSCRFCRFKKCLASGMKPAWVLNDQERKIRHAKRTKKPEIATLIRNPDDLFTEQEMMLFLNQSNEWRDFAMTNFHKFYAGNPDVFRTLISCMYKRSLIPYETLMVMEKTMVNTLTRYFATKCEGVKSLSANDRHAILTNNVVLMWNAASSVLLGSNVMFFFANLHFVCNFRLKFDKIYLKFEF